MVMTETNMGSLVAALPEKYQPIYAHPELSEGSSRGCEDRLVLIRELAARLQAALGRPLRVLDLGCAQGFFSLSLAAEGHRVHGVDFLDLNVHVCQGLADENPGFEATFEHNTVEVVIDRIQEGDFDLVLGLSVFHHLVHEKGILSVSDLCRKLADVVGAGIFELALREEPLYWAPSLPLDPAELLAGYAFTRLLARQETHLSAVARPLYFASSRFWYVDETIGGFTGWSSESHAHGRGTHHQSRRYYFGDNVFVKKMTLGTSGRAEINRQEFANEVAFLRAPPAGYSAPGLIAALDDSSDLFLARESVPGRLLSELIDEGVDYDADRVVSELLDQLVQLERVGLYHNDVRCWNVLMSSSGEAVLIDYGAISHEAQDCSWMQDLQLSFLITIKEILSRRVVSSSPGREPSLDFLSLPPRYRNAFIEFFGQDVPRWTFESLQEALERSSSSAAPAPQWSQIYQHLQEALLSYNERLGGLYTQTEHDRVELAARAAAIERLREVALLDQTRIEAFEQSVAEAEAKYRQLEESSEKLTDWAKTLEEQAIRAGADSESLAARAAGLDSDKKALVSEIEELRVQLAERQHARELAELLAMDVSRLTQERDDARSELFDSQQIIEEQAATVIGLHARIEALDAQIRRLTTSRAQDRVRISELRKDLSQGAQHVGTARERIRELEMSVEALDGQLARVYASRSWRITRPLRWFTTRVLKRGSPSGDIGSATNAPSLAAATKSGEVPTPAQAAVEKKLAALDQLGRRIRNKRI